MASGIRNLQTVARRFKRLSNKLPSETMGQIVHAIGAEGAIALVQNTPRDTGETVSSWRVDHSATGSESSPITTEDGQFPPNSAIMARLVSRVWTIKPFSRWYIYNPHPRAVQLEMGSLHPSDPGPSEDERPERKGKILVRGGHSTQAPKGMLRHAIARIALKLRQIEMGARNSG